MDILLAISEMPPARSGMARSGQRLREGFQAAGHRVRVLTTDDAKRVSIGEARFTGLVPRWPWLRKRLDGVDVVSLHGPVPTFSDALLVLLALSRRKRGPRVVYTHHFDLDFEHLALPSRAYNWLQRRLARLADHVVTETPSYAATFASSARSEWVTAIPPGVDRLAPSPPISKNGQPTALFVGQLRRYKGVSTLIEAAGRVPDLQVVIAGDGPERHTLERMAAGLRNVRFTGGVSEQELWELYRAAHVVVLPSVSRLEAFGLVLLEGMAAGCVPVASALPGVADVVGDVGFSYPPGDASALAQVLDSLTHNPSMLRECSQRAARRSEAFTWEETTRRYLALFESLLQRSAGVTPAKAAVR